MSRKGNNLKRFDSKTLSTESRAYGFIQKNIATRTARGDEIKEWENTSLQPHSFALLPMSATQINEYKSQNVEATHLIKIRAEIPVSELNRFIVNYGEDNERVFEIKTIDDIQERGVLNWVFTKERRS
jgi:head-tail adaptor